MPKKFATENTKAVQARERKKAAKEAEREEKQKAIDDQFWKDEDKHVIRKQQRKEDKEKKHHEQMEKKILRKQLEESELSTIVPSHNKPPPKVTLAMIMENTSKKSVKPTTPKNVEVGTPLEENVNRIEVEGDVARTITDAISILSTDAPLVEKHPEKRMKAAYTVFEETNLPRLKAENPNLRLSQLKQILRKDWLKSPENPLNQNLAAYNERRQ